MEPVADPAQGTNGRLTASGSQLQLYTGGDEHVHTYRWHSMFLIFRRLTKRELAEYRIEEVTNPFESSVNLIRHLLDKKFVQLSI